VLSSSPTASVVRRIVDQTSRLGFLFTGSHDTRIKVWDGQKSFDFVGELDGHDYTVWSLFLTDGKLYSGSADCTIREWDLPALDSAATPYAAKHVRTIKIPAANSKIYSICVRENMLFAASYKSIYVWDLRIGEVAHVLSGHLDSVWGVTIQNNNLFSCSDDHSVRVWDLSTYSEVHHLQSDEPDTRFLSLAVGCGYIFAGTQDAKIKVWSLATYDLVTTLSGHSWEVWQLALHPAGFLFSASFDHTIRCWMIPESTTSSPDFTCIYNVKAHKGYIHALLVHAASSTLFTGSGDKSIKVWSYNGPPNANGSESSS
jgi:E3 ubiquitin-protein ligase TRAF7